MQIPEVTTHIPIMATPGTLTTLVIDTNFSALVIVWILFFGQTNITTPIINQTNDPVTMKGILKPPML